MMPPWRLGRRFGKPVVASNALAGLVLFASALQADTVVSGTAEALSGGNASDPEVSIWVDAAPLGLVIRQLAALSGRAAEVEEPAEIEKVAEAEQVAEIEKSAEAEQVAKIEEIAQAADFAGVPVSGRFSGSLSSTLATLSANYPVIFDLNGKTLRAMNGAARSTVSIAMLSSTFDEAFKNELLASSGAGNSVEFREDAVRVSGHPAFVKRQTGYITTARKTVQTRLNADSLIAESGTTVATSLADSGSAELLVDIQDEGKPPAEQANLSKPIRWVTDIPGYHTF